MHDLVQHPTLCLQVHTVLSCLQALNQSGENFGLRPPPSRSTSDRMQGQGDKEEEEEEEDMSSVGVSMYHSAMGSIFGAINESMPAADSAVLHDDSGSTSGSTGNRKRLTSEQLRRSLSDANQRLLVASEKQISAKLSINEVLLSLNSKG